MPELHRSDQMRKGRYSEMGRIYLLTSVVHNRRPVFANPMIGRLLVQQFRQTQQEGAATSLAWVVMPDHFHWLIQLEDTSLSALMRTTKSRAARAVNTALNSSDCLWQRGFHDRAVRREEDLQKLADYIIANPLRAGLVERIEDYALWDSVWV